MEWRFRCRYALKYASIAQRWKKKKEKNVIEPTIRRARHAANIFQLEISMSGIFYETRKNDLNLAQKCPDEEDREINWVNI